jgi:C-terminal processing protease CtpA/Prc
MKSFLSIVAILSACAVSFAQTEWNKEIVIDPATPGGTPQMGILNLAGICAVVRKDKETNKVLITQVLPEGAAEKAGLLQNDEIVFIDKQTIEGVDLENVVSFLRGDPGTQVTVSVMRKGFSTPKDFIVTREPVRLKEVPSK